MKKLTAILLLTILLFNIGGHLVCHQYFSYRSEQFFNQQIAKSRYNLKDLSEIKIPVNLPCISDQDSYQDITGQVNLESNSYNYVKMKLTKTAIYLMCVPNYETTQLSGQNIIDAKGVKDIPVPQKDHVPFGKLALIVYSHQQSQYLLATPITTAFRRVAPYITSAVTQSVIDGPLQPPDATSFLS